MKFDFTTELTETTEKGIDFEELHSKSKEKPDKVLATETPTSVFSVPSLVKSSGSYGIALATSARILASINDSAFKFFAAGTVGTNESMA